MSSCSEEFLEEEEENNQIDETQMYMDRYTTYIVRKCGGENNLKAKFLTEVSKVAVGNTNPLLDDLQPRVRIDDTIPQWNKAYRMVLAFLRKNKMTETLHAMRQEYPNVPKHTGYSKNTELDHEYHQLIDVNRRFTQGKTFQEKIGEFSELLGMKYEPEKEPTWDPLELSTVPHDEVLTVTSTMLDSTFDDKVLSAKVDLENCDKRKVKVKVENEKKEHEKIRVRVRRHNENGEPYVHQHPKEPESGIIGTKVVKTKERKVSPGGTPRVVTKTKIIKLKPHYIPPPKGYYAAKTTAANTKQDSKSSKSSLSSKEFKPADDLELEEFDFGTEANQMQPAQPNKPKETNESSSTSKKSKQSFITPPTAASQRRSRSTGSFSYIGSSSPSDDEIKTLPEHHSPTALDKLQMFIVDKKGKGSSNTMDGDNPVFRSSTNRVRTIDGVAAKKASKRYKDGTIVKKQLNDPIARVANQVNEYSGTSYSLTSKESYSARLSRPSTNQNLGSTKEYSYSYSSSGYSID